MTEMMFYERVAPLNEARHVALKVLPAKTFAYAARTNSVPIVGSEFFECAREYPIVFVQGQTCPLPAVLLGLRESENLYVDTTGKWDARYVPAFVRRYPFVPAKGPQDDLLVCIDEASPCFSEAEAQLEHAIRFLREFHQSAAATERMCRRLADLGLLRQADSVAELKDGSRFRLNGLQVVDEAKLRALDKEVVQELFGNGGLALIHAHLISLGNLAGLVDRLSKRGKRRKKA